MGAIPFTHCRRLLAFFFGLRSGGVSSAAAIVCSKLKGIRIALGYLLARFIRLLVVHVYLFRGWQRQLPR
jgi:hypothetical protein